MLLFFRNLKRYVLILLMMTVLFSGVGVFLNYFFLQNQYETAASVYVLWENPDKTANLYTAMLTSELIAADVREYLTSQKVVDAASKAIKANHPDVGPGTITKMVTSMTSTVQIGTRILNITMRGKDPKTIADFLNAMIDSVITESDALYSSNVIRVMTRAVPIPEPVSPKKLRDTLFIGIGGLIAGVMLVMLITYLNTQHE